MAVLLDFPLELHKQFNTAKLYISRSLSQAPKCTTVNWICCSQCPVYFARFDIHHSFGLLPTDWPFCTYRQCHHVCRFLSPPESGTGRDLSCFSNYVCTFFNPEWRRSWQGLNENGMITARDSRDGHCVNWVARRLANFLITIAEKRSLSTMWKNVIAIYAVARCATALDGYCA